MSTSSAPTVTFASLHHPSRHYGVYAQLATHRGMVGFPSLVTEGAVAWNDADSGKLSEIVDNALGNSFAQVVRFRIAARVHERQNG
jgi:hypothetical protein